MSVNLPEGFDSIFRYIAVVSQRAEQLINGAKKRGDCRSTKSTLQAKADVDQGLVEWRVLTQEEIDAQRQAIVDQFRAEVGAEELPALEGRQIPDVLRTEVEAAAEAETQEQDNELARLQRLLGLSVDRDSSSDDGHTASEDDDGEAELASPSDDDLDLDVDDEESYETESLEDGSFTESSYDDEEEQDD